MNPDPLAALRPPHPPDPVSWWPPAPGWWLLMLALLALTAWGALRLLRHLRRNRYRRTALAELDQAYARHRDGAAATQYAAAAALILRRAALARYPRAEVAALTGEQWLAFLDRSGGAGAFAGETGRALLRAAYQPSARCDAAALHGICRDWLRRHR